MHYISIQINSFKSNKIWNATLDKNIKNQTSKQWPLAHSLLEAFLVKDNQPHHCCTFFWITYRGLWAWGRQRPTLVCIETLLGGLRTALWKTWITLTWWILTCSPLATNWELASPNLHNNGGSFSSWAFQHQASRCPGPFDKLPQYWYWGSKPWFSYSLPCVFMYSRSRKQHG